MEWLLRVMPLKWGKKQQAARDLVANNDEVMLFGGAGSGKTWVLLDIIWTRAWLVPGSRHACMRQRFEHAKGTLWPSIQECLIAAQGREAWAAMKINKAGGTWEITLPNGSEIWVGGLDDKERVEKWLGSEFATVYINECSQITDAQSVDLVTSRLRQKLPEGRTHKALFDMNPPSKKHWSYKRFVEEGRPHLKINPADNAANLPAAYLERLQQLPKRLRDRFWHGDFISDTEGALWTMDLIEQARQRAAGTPKKTVIGVDPAVTNQADSDLTGILVATLDDEDGAIIEADYSMKASPEVWAQAAVNAYHQHDADAIVAEVNQGGDLIEMAIKNIDRTVRVRTVRASKGKHARAEPVVQLYEQGRISHAEGLDDLENEMLEYVPLTSKKSPDRMDAMVWAVYDLLLKTAPVPSIRFL